MNQKIILKYFFLLVPLSIVAGAGYLSWLVYGRIDTHYAVRYSEEAFKALSAGMSKDEVKTLLGAPLDTGTVRSGEVWYYSEQGVDKTANYYVRNVHFGQDGLLSRTYSELHLD